MQIRFEEVNSSSRSSSPLQHYTVSLAYAARVIDKYSLLKEAKKQKAKRTGRKTVLKRADRWPIRMVTKK